MSVLTWLFKDPDEVLDYQIVWTDRLAGDTIHAFTWTLPAGLTLQREDSDDTKATIWLAGGIKGETYAVLNRITTSAGRVMDQSVRLSVRAK